MKRRGDKSESSGDRRNAYERGLAMLARREHSQRELRIRLERAEYNEAETEAALRQLRGLQYQDDGRFGEMIVRTRVGQGYGPARIRAELRSHGLDDAAIRALLEAAEADWVMLAYAQLRKKYGGKSPTDHAERGKRAAFLLRRGFAAATVRIVTHSDVETPDD